MSALGSLVVKLALDYAEYTQGLDRSSQEALKFSKQSQDAFDKAGRSTKEFLSNTAANVGGAIASVVGLNAAFTQIRDSINILDSLDDAAQKTGSSIEDLSRIQQVARNFNDAFAPIEQGITKLSKNLAAIDDPSNDAIRALDALGISARDSQGVLRKSADVYIEVARALQNYEDGNSKAAVATALFGKSGVELLPALNNLAQGIGNVTAVSAASAAQAAQFNDQVAQAKSRVNAWFMSMSVELLPTLNAIAGSINQATGEVGQFSLANEAAKNVLKGVAIAAYAVVTALGQVGREIGGRAAQLAALARLDFKSAGFIGEEITKDFVNSQIEFKKFVDAIWSGEQKINTAVETGGTKKTLDFQPKLQQALQTTTQAVEKQTKAFDIELYKLRQYQDDARRARDITDSVATKQERYNKTLEELERLKPYLTIETYNRALEKAQGELDKTAIQTRTATDEVSQMWIQAGRNIQSALGNLVFDFFSGGLDNMVKNAGNAVLRIMSEFAGLRIAQGLGLASLFTAGTAAASTGAAAGGGMSLLSGASLAANGLSLFKSGFGATSLLSGVGSMLPGSAGAFFSGIGGGAIPGVSSSAALAGGSFGAMLGPVAALAGVDVIGRMLAGDKKLGGAEMIPVIGGFLAAMFGRGPYKFRQQSLQGTVSQSGFDGDITNVFRSKGGLFMSNKHKSVTEQLTPEMQMLFDSTIGGFFQAASASAANLGLDAKLVENFTKEIQIKSEKGQKLTEEAITKMLQGIGDDIAKAALPVVDEFKKIGETSIQTLSRLSNEFTVLTGAAGLLFNKSAEWSKGFVSSFGFGDRAAFLDKAGGADAFAAMVAGFSQNFLTEDQRMRPVIESLVSQRDALGLSNINTRQQVTDAVQSGRLNVDQLLFLFKNQEAINQVFNYLGKFNGAVNETAESLANATRELNIRNADETEYGQRLNKGIQETTAAISQLESIADQLRGTVNSINPLSVEQARRIVSSGNLNDPNLQAALGVLSGMDSSGFVSGLDFQRAKGKNASAVIGLQGFVSGRIAQENSRLSQFMFEKEMLQQSLANAAVAYSAALPRYAAGTSYVPNTGLAMVHRGERIINPQQNNDLIGAIKQLAKEMKESKVSTEDLRRLMRNAMVETNGGLSLRTSTT